MITEFANRYRLKAKRDSADDRNIVPGKNGHIYEYSDSELGVCFIPEAERTRYWHKHSDACVTAGMTLRQNGDSEGCLSFNPDNPVQVKLAIKLAAIKAKRRMSPEALARLQTFAYKQSRPAQEGRFGTLKTSDRRETGNSSK